MTRTEPNAVFRLYEKSAAQFQSSIFDLIDGDSETKQTKGLAYLFKSDHALLLKFLSIPSIQKELKLLHGFDVTSLKRIDYIEVYAEMLAEGKRNLRRDITVYFYRGGVKVLFLVIEAKHIALNAYANIEDQLLQYFDPQHFPDDYTIPHLGIALTKWKEQLITPHFVSVEWRDVIGVLHDHSKSSQMRDPLVREYYTFITRVDKGMNYYEQEVLSIPAGVTFPFITQFNVHACPDTKGYSYKDAIFITFRKSGSEMERLYKIEKVLVLDPDSPSLTQMTQDLPYRERLLGYIKERGAKCPYGGVKFRFYVLSEKDQIPLTHKPKPATRCEGHRYFTLSQMLSGEKIIGATPTPVP